MQRVSQKLLQMQNLIVQADLKLRRNCATREAFLKLWKRLQTKGQYLGN